jgi:hypothetical protein
MVWGVAQILNIKSQAPWDYIRSKMWLGASDEKVGAFAIIRERTRKAYL